jgi:thiol-disulfide isomerase/thioredoxin
VSGPGLGVAAAVLAVATLAGLVYRSRYGRLAATTRIAEVPAELVTREPGSVTLLHFSASTCAPCRQVRRVCASVADDNSRVRHLELDAETRLDAVRVLGIHRLPTLLVVDDRGRVARRTVGVPSRADLDAVIHEVLAA